MPGERLATESVDVEARVREVRERIAAAAKRVGRDPAEVLLVGVTKRQPFERVVAGVKAGLLAIGENYVQEARDKRPALEAALPAEIPPPRWHLIGHLQRNKAKLAAGLFEQVETVDRAALARELDKRCGALGRELEICLQVNLSGEAQKSGVDAAALPGLMAECADLEHVRVVGLMTIPRAAQNPEDNRAVFARLRELRDRLCDERGGGSLRELSMGMSGDFEIAVEEGATRVRVGTALFGPREDTA